MNPIDDLEEEVAENLEDDPHFYDPPSEHTEVEEAIEAVKELRRLVKSIQGAQAYENSRRRSAK